MNLLYVTAAGAFAAAIALGFAIPALVRRARLDELARLPIARERAVDLPAGEIILHLAGPLGRTGLGALSFKLLDANGAAAPSSPLLVRSRVSTGLRNVVLAVCRFRVPLAASYRLVVDGIPEERKLSDCSLLLARPRGAKLAVSIIAVVVAAVALIACSVLSLILSLSPAAVAAQTIAADTLAPSPPRERAGIPLSTFPETQ